MINPVTGTAMTVNVRGFSQERPKDNRENLKPKRNLFFDELLTEKLKQKERRNLQ